MERTAKSTMMRPAAVGQAVLCALGIVACALAPRPGGAVLLVPMPGASAALAATAGASPNDGARTPPAILRPGVIDGSLLVRFGGPVPVLAILRTGVLPVAAPLWLCRAVPTGSTPLDKDSPR